MASKYKYLKAGNMDFVREILILEYFKKQIKKQKDIVYKMVTSTL